MAAMEKILGFMRLSGEDDDYYDDDEYYDEDDYEEEPARKKTSTKQESVEEETDAERLHKTSSKITPMRSSKKKLEPGKEVRVLKPKSMEEAREITEALLSQRTIVLNMEGIDIDMAQRIIDFASGSCFAVKGNLQKVSNYIFVITPATVDISGDIQNIVDPYDGIITTDI